MSGIRMSGIRMSGATEGSGRSMPALTKARAGALLRELLEGLKPKVSKKKAEAASGARKEASGDRKEQLPGPASSVLREVLPKYGFEDGDQGLVQMWQAMGPLLASERGLEELAEAVRRELQKFSRARPEPEPEFQPEAKEETIAAQSLGYVRPANWVTRKVWVMPRVPVNSGSWSLFLDLSEGMTVGDLRKQLQPHFPVDPPKIRLQECVGGAFRNLEDTAGAERATAMYLPHSAVPPDWQEPRPSVARERLLEMQRAYLARVSEPEFQRSLQDLIDKHRKIVSCYGACSKRPLFWRLPGREALTRNIHKEVFAKVGFQHDAMSLAAACEPYLADMELCYLCESVNEKMAYPPQLFDLRRVTC